MMKPFSPLYFIKENKARCFLIIFMVFLTYTTYLGGIYVTNSGQYYNYDYDYLKKFAYVYYIKTDENMEDYHKMKEMLSSDEKVILIPQGQDNTMLTQTVMGFNSSFLQFTFCSAENFKIFCNHMNINCDFDNLKSGSAIMSPMSAKNAGVKICDELKEGRGDLNGKYTFDALTDEAGYHIYYINDQPYDFAYLILNNGRSEDEFSDYTDMLMDKYNVGMVNLREYTEIVESNLEILNVLYIFILIIFILVLAVIINAIFVGMYQRRQYEFSVYKALGYGRKQIVGKIAGELICIDIIGLTVGGVVFFLSLYLLNNLYLERAGKFLFYYHPLALFGLMLCNVVMIVPLIFTRCRQMLRADICEY